MSWRFMGPVLGVVRTSDMRVLPVILYLGFIEVSVCTGGFYSVFGADASTIFVRCSWSLVSCCEPMACRCNEQLTTDNEHHSGISWPVECMRIVLRARSW